MYDKGRRIIRRRRRRRKEVTGGCSLLQSLIRKPNEDGCK
jgi:hypothetical protein